VGKKKKQNEVNNRRKMQFLENPPSATLREGESALEKGNRGVGIKGIWRRETSIFGFVKEKN
jgi:hypothetical protein